MIINSKIIENKNTFWQVRIKINTLVSIFLAVYMNRLYPKKSDILTNTTLLKCIIFIHLLDKRHA